MSNRTDEKTNPTGHLPDLFRRTLKTGSAKGGLVSGEPSPLLPWLIAPAKGMESTPSVPSVKVVEQERVPVPLEHRDVTWLRLSFTTAIETSKSTSSTFQLRAISHVGFGFGVLPPW